MRLNSELSSRPQQPAFSCVRVLRAVCGVEGPRLDLNLATIGFLTLLTLLFGPSARAEYVVLRSAQRLHVTGYQLNGDTYHLQLPGGTADIPASEVTAIEPEEIFYPIPRVETSKASFREIIQAAAARYAIDPDLITSVIAAESNFDPKAVSRRNACGLMQLLPQIAARLGVTNVFDPAENINAGTHYLSELLKRYNNNLALTLAAYNAGPQTIQRYGRVPPFSETQTYIQKVGRNYAQRKSGAPNAASTKNSSSATIAATRSPQNQP
jgi:soluble lytic murein transglycosylase-like protein